MTQATEKPALSQWLYDAGRVICRIVTTVLFDLKVYGLEHVPMRGGVLLLSNHQSYLDPVMIAVKLMRPMSFLAKSELFESPGFSWLIRNLNAYPVKQGAGDVGAVRETIRRLDEGHALIVFPEGSRTPDGKIAPLQSGFALIARKIEVPIVPVAIVGSYESWGRKQGFFPHPIRVKFGPPLNVKGLKAGEIVTLVDKTLREMFAELKRAQLKENGSLHE